MKPIVFSERWEDVMFTLRNASKILLHFYTTSRIIDGENCEPVDIHIFDNRLSEEDFHLIYGESANIALKLIVLSNDILDFYGDPGNEFVEFSEYIDLLKENQDNIPGSIAYDFISYWCIPSGQLSDDEYNEFVDKVIEGNDFIPDLAYRVLKVLKYGEFLKTRYWMSISRYVREKAGKCEECGETTNLHVHHTTYEHHGYEHRHLEDLRCLCKDCHLKAHHEMNKKS